MLRSNGSAMLDPSCYTVPKPTCKTVSTSCWLQRIPIGRLSRSRVRQGREVPARASGRVCRLAGSLTAAWLRP
jgi:hypothetical protein